MKAVVLALFVGLGGLSCVTPAFAQVRTPTPSACVVCRGAPAPLIGLGVPGILALGGVLLGAKFWTRRKDEPDENSRVTYS